jgi:hypothetical protein
MSNKSVLDEIKTILSRPYPDVSKIRSSVERRLWRSAIDNLEGRLVFACVLRNKAWLSGPKDMSFLKNVELGVMGHQHVNQARLLMEQYIVSFASKKYDSVEVFPFKEIMIELLRFKASLEMDPALNLLFRKAGSALSLSGQEEYPAPIIIQTAGMSSLAWYKYYAFYSVLLGVVNFNSELLKRMAFDPSWVNDDESVIIMLFSYAVSSNQSQLMLPRLAASSERVLQNNPTFKPIHFAIKALIQNN